MPISRCDECGQWINDKKQEHHKEKHRQAREQIIYDTLFPKKEYKVNIDFWNPPEKYKDRLPYLERI